MDTDNFSIDKLDSLAHSEVKCERDFRKLLGKKYVKTYNIKNIKRKKTVLDVHSKKDYYNGMTNFPCSTQALDIPNSNTMNEEKIESEKLDMICNEGTSGNVLEDALTLRNKNCQEDQIDSLSVPAKQAENSLQFEKKCERDFRKLLESTSEKNLMDTNNGENKAYRYNIKTDCKDVQNSSSVYPAHCSNFIFENMHVFSEAYHLAPCKIITAMRKEDIDFETLSKVLSQPNLKKRTFSVMSLALFCMKGMSTLHLHSIFEAIKQTSYSYESTSYAVSYSLLLLALSKRDLSLSQICFLESLIVRLTEEFLASSDDLRNLQEISNISVLDEELYKSAIQLCQCCLEEMVDTDLVDVFTICCSSLQNLLTIKSGERHRYSENTLKFILGLTGKATQDIVSEYLISGKKTEDTVSAASHLVKQCLLILEHILTLDPDFPCTTLNHEDFSILHCLTRLLGWCVSYLFRDYTECCNSDFSLSPFHLSTLVSILKILSILSFNPNQYNNFTNVKGLMEKVMICILKVYFHSNQKHFDVLVLALELMINFFIKHKKKFALLCLKNFSINKCEQILGIEALLKMLHNSLDKIAEIKTKSLKPPPGDGTSQVPNTSQPSEDTDNDSLQLVLADEDMELSTIVSFISILVAFFMEIKVSFTDFIRERLPVERSNDAVSVSKKVLQFASITGGMPATGVLLLRHAIRKLTILYAPS